MAKIRVGYGYDVHQLAEGERLVLGGIGLEHHKGCVAHSDGDVLIHAIMDALFGAAGLRDIGYHFPDTSKEFEKIDSKVLLRRCVETLSQHGWQIGNIDATLCLQRPKIKYYISTMCKTLATVMDIPVEDVSIKATTTEKLGFVGEERGVEAHAVALIERQ